MVDGTEWKWEIGKGGGFVLAYSEKGERKCDHGSVLKGMTPDDFDDAIWDRSSDAGVTPKDVADWLRK